MKPKAVMQLLRAQIQETLKGEDDAVPVYIWGPPGVGKSDIVREAAVEHSLPVYDLRANLLDPTDLRGIPIAQDGQARWLPPVFLPKHGPGILFLDELNVAPPLVQGSMYQLVLDRRVGEYELPDDVFIIAAGNRSGDRTPVHPMSSALASRFRHIDYEVDLDDWFEWAWKHNILPEVTAFLKFRPNLLHHFEPKKDDRAFPCPRTWEFTSRLLKQHLPPDIEAETVAGTVGAGAGAEFTAFKRVFRELPDPEDILLRGKNTVPNANRLDLLYALAMAIAHRAEPKQYERAIDYSFNIPEEFAVLLIKSLVAKNKEAVAMAPSWPKWASKFRDLLVE